jgi:hypothetical protein
MKILSFFTTILVATFCLPVFADCAQECDKAYEECKAAHDSPNGQKVCGSDYHECKEQCAGSNN